MHRVLLPSPGLAPFVHSFNVFTLDSAALSSRGISRKMVPDSLVDIWLTRGKRLRYKEQNQAYRTLPQYMAWGVFDCCGFLEAPGPVSIFSTKFFPWAFDLFVPTRMPSLCNRQLALDSLLAPQAWAAFAPVLKADNAEACVRAMETWLQSQLHSLQRSHVLSQSAYNRIVAAAGSCTVEDLAEAEGVTRQYLSRCFREHTGFGIKAYMGVYRMRLVVDYYVNTPTASLSDLAHRFAFFDQAHFIRQFKIIIGETPRSYFAGRHLLKQHLRD